MNLFSLTFLGFLAIVFVLYYAIPARYRYLLLSAASILFYASWNVKYLAVLALEAATAYLFAVCLQKMEDSTQGDVKSAASVGRGSDRIAGAGGVPAESGCAVTTTPGRTSLARRGILWISLIFLVGILLFFKLGHLEAPLGISFYTLAAIGYLADVAAGKFRAEKNFLRLFLFLGFFPCIISGPIERSNTLLKQLQGEVTFSYDGVKRGTLYAMWGFFMKILIADRLSIIVASAYDHFPGQSGMTMLIIAMFFIIQLYADFAGYSYIVVGVGKMLGFELTNNFRQPFFSTSITELWSRWHISLSTWLRDYIYIPLGGNRKGLARKCLNLMITFLISGLWHGTGMKFIVWGLLQGAYVTGDTLLTRCRNKGGRRERVRDTRLCRRLPAMILTFLLYAFGMIFFRASSLTQALQVIWTIPTDLRAGETLFNRSYLNGYDYERFVLLLFELLILLAVDFLKEIKFGIIAFLDKQTRAFRWTIYLAGSVMIIFGAIYNYGGDASAFIYASF